MLAAAIIEGIAGIVASNARRYDTAGDREIAPTERAGSQWSPLRMASNARRYGLRA